MPLSPSVLSSLIETNLKSQFNYPGSNDADLKKMCDAIANAVVTHITSAAVVNVTVTTAGGPTAQAGTGVGNIT